tara:strand:- start:4331 stop:4765 length:435 start_codon:yes stop_codon:yes gene_type:complete
MRGWRANENIDFNFFDAHDLKPLTDLAGEDTVKRRLKERLSNTKQAIVIIGDSTKNLYRFVRWELQTCLDLDIPIIAVNLDGSRRQNNDFCPAIIRDEYVVYIPFKLKIIQHALDNFPSEYHRRNLSDKGPRFYNESIYKQLGI